MIFTNPAIIQSPEDGIIGAVKSRPTEISYLEYMRLVESRLLRLLIMHVHEEMNEETDYNTALKSVAGSIYQYLNFDSKKYPEKEEDIVEEIMMSLEFRHWETLVLNRFYAVHPGVVTKDYPIPVAVENKALDDLDIHSVDFLDVMQALSSVYTITY